MTRLLISDARSETRKQVVITATTNKAARVLQEFVEEPVYTIHSLFHLRVTPNFRTGKEDLRKSPQTSVIHDTIIFIDEGSMVDDDLWQIVTEHTHNCRFIVIGDKDQLAPVGQAKPPLFYKGFMLSELKTVMRQMHDSEIVGLATQWRNTINTGRFLPMVAADIDVHWVTGDDFKALVDARFTEDVKADKYKIICWRNESVKAYNNYIRNRFFPEEHYTVYETVVTNGPISNGQETIYSTDELATISSFRPGQLHGIGGYYYTLDRGIEVFCATDPNDVRNLLQQLANSAKAGGSWVKYFKAKEAFADLRPVHACTAHKSQGSSYDAVFIDLDDIGQCRDWETVARMLYVAITRAKKKVYLYGSLPSKYQNFSYKVQSHETPLL